MGKKAESFAPGKLPAVPLVVAVASWTGSLFIGAIMASMRRWPVLEIGLCVFFLEPLVSFSSESVCWRDWE